MKQDRAEAVEAYLEPTWFIDSDAPTVIERARRAVGDAGTEIEKAVRLYYTVRDGIRYDPYAWSGTRDDYRASRVAEKPGAYCIQKAVLLAAEARAVSIPARLGFADVRNHLTTPKLRELMQSDLFIYHGYTELHLEGKWVKATPAFNLALCDRFGVLPLEFDGRSDSIFHEFDREKRRHMEYVRTRGSFAELPFDEIMRAFETEYPGIFDRMAGGKPVEDRLFRPAS